MAVTLVGGVGQVAEGVTASVTPVFGQATTAGNLLVCGASATTNTGFTISGPSGWVNANAAGQSGNRAELWYKANCAANETAPTVNCALAVVMRAQLTEYVGAASVSPLGTSGTATAGAVSGLTVTTAGNVSGGGGSLGVAVFSNLAAIGAAIWLPGTGWINCANNITDAATGFHMAVDRLLNPPTAATLSEAGADTCLAQVTWSGVIATFLAAPVPLAYGYGSN